MYLIFIINYYSLVDHYVVVKDLSAKKYEKARMKMTV